MTPTEHILRTRIIEMRETMKNFRKMEARIERDKKRPARIMKLTSKLRRIRRRTMSCTSLFWLVVPAASIIALQKYEIVDPATVAEVLNKITNLLVLG